MHVALVFERDDAVQTLSVRFRSQRRRREDLRLSARKDARTVDAGHVVDLAPDRPDLVGLAAVGADLLVHDHRAQLVFFHRLDDFAEVFRSGRRFEQRLDVVVLLGAAFERFGNRQRRKGAFALALFDDAHRFGDVLGERFANPLVEVGVDFLDRELAFLLARFFRELIDRLDDLFDLALRELDRAEEIFLADLFAAAFDHHDRIGRAGDDDVHAAGDVLVERRIDDVLAVFVASDANRGNRLLERNVAERERRAGRADADDVGVEHRIHREHRRDDLNVVTEAVGEQRTDGAIDLTRTEHRVLGGAAFALDESARNLAGGVHLLFEVAGEWEKVYAFARFCGGGDGAEHDVLIPVTNERRAVGLLCQFAGFDDHRAPADRKRNGFGHDNS